MSTDPTPVIRSYGITDVGRRRSNNEDGFLIGEAERIYAVADGMGGAAAGEVASGLFMNAVRQAISRRGTGSRAEAVELARLIFASANRDITAHVSYHPECEGMGCTADVLLICDSGYVIGHVGDSRVYLQRDERLVQLTRDHSWIQQQIDEGLLTKEQARGHRLSHLITRAVGTADSVSVDLVQGRVDPGDRFLLCTDGLVDMVPDEDIHRILATDVSLADKTVELVKTANDKGGRDNITAVVVEVLG